MKTKLTLSVDKDLVQFAHDRPTVPVSLFRIFFPSSYQLAELR